MFAHSGHLALESILESILELILSIPYDSGIDSYRYRLLGIFAKPGIYYTHFSPLSLADLHSILNLLCDYLVINIMNITSIIENNLINSLSVEYKLN